MDLCVCGIVVAMFSPNGMLIFFVSRIINMWQNLDTKCILLEACTIMCMISE
jgi:hypothetical protein